MSVADHTDASLGFVESSLTIEIVHHPAMPSKRWGWRISGQAGGSPYVADATRSFDTASEAEANVRHVVAMIMQGDDLIVNGRSSWAHLPILSPPLVAVPA